MKLDKLRTKTEEDTLNHSKIVSEAEWLVARKELLMKEKELTRQRDALSAERRKLPWVKVEKEYVFDALYRGKNGNSLRISSSLG